jgi:decaprenylphospho-beta-D-ribofuranose 2-oxidase
VVSVAQRDSGRLLTGWGRATPSRAKVVIAQILKTAQRHRCATFPGTLRRIGPESGGRPGWSVSIDMPGGHRQLGPMLDDPDLRVAAVGGRVDLARDSRLSGRTCAAMYPRLAEWQAVASRLDPAGVFRSDLGQRLGLRQAGATSSGRQHAG